MSTLFLRAGLVALALFTQACEDSGPAGAPEITEFCTALHQIANGPKECRAMAMDLARLADDQPKVRMKNHDALLRSGTPNAEERRSYDSCKTGIALVGKKCAGKTGASFALRAIKGDAIPGGSSAEAWVKEGNREDSGNELLKKAF